MPSMLADALAWLAEQQQAHDSVNIVYRRGLHTASFAATLGRTQIEVTEPTGGQQVSYTDADFTFPPGLLVLNGQQAEPQRGDLIELVRGAKRHTYTLLPEPGFEAWTWCDPHHTQLRVRTKQTKVEDV